MNLQLQGKTCLVTGASRGIGHGAAQVLATGTTFRDHLGLPRLEIGAWRTTLAAADQTGPRLPTALSDRSL
jgi:NAD(P)-dependent dehydrogenase (short-subunit alcohol dehydrogenase family)